MNASVTVCSRLAGPANKLVWSPLVVLALQILLLPLLALFRNNPHTSNAFAFGSLSLTAIGLLAGLAALPFANQTDLVAAATAAGSGLAGGGTLSDDRQRILTPLAHIQPPLSVA